MIVQRLRDFHARIADDLIPSYHKAQDVRWLLDLDAEGRFQGFVGTEKTITSPYRGRSGRKPPPYLLVDKPEYVLGLPREDEQAQAGPDALSLSEDELRARIEESTDDDALSEEELDNALADLQKNLGKVRWRFDAYRELVAACAEDTEAPALRALLTFLDEHVADARRDERALDMDPTSDLIAPRVDGKLLTDLPEVRQFWIGRQDSEADEKSNLEARCIVCGEERPVARIHPVELVLGGNRVKLVSGNEKAFLSYGLEQSEIAPMCQPCARTYGEALRYLLSDDAHHFRLGDVTWLYWTREPSDLDPFGALAEANPRDVENLLDAARRGTAPAHLKNNDFYALACTANVSRLAVRSWLTESVAEVQQRLGEYFARMELTGRDGEARHHNVFALAGATVRELRDLPPRVVPDLIEHALTGRTLPRTLLHRTLQRARAEGRITHPRAALIKLVLLSNQPDHQPPMIDDTLTTSHERPAYQCGRLLALLENIQDTALDNPNTTLVDRYFGTASTAPASVFGNLLRNAQSHLSKLRRDESTKGLHHYFQDELGAVMSRLDGFPRTLGAEDQGLFALGYYQQRHASGKKQDDSDEA
jgi:CRISPR-associated protein Csd1